MALPEKNDKKVISNVFTLEELFAIPLKAVIEANAAAAETAVKFIKKYGFLDPKEAEPSKNKNDLGQLRMASFTYNYQDDRGQIRTTGVKIPFLSLIPIPLLEVKQAIFEYAIQILDHNETVKNPFPPAEDSKKLSVMAMLAPLDTRKPGIEYSSSTLQANMSVRIEVERSDLPAGILQLLNLGQEAIEGSTDYIYEITIDPPGHVYFRPGFYAQSLTIKTKKIRPDIPDNDADLEVTAEVLSNTYSLNEMFVREIIIEKGDPVGFPSIGMAKAIATDGEAIFSFESRSVVQFNANGFILIKVPGAKDKLIYFNINT